MNWAHNNRLRFLPLLLLMLGVLSVSPSLHASGTSEESDENLRISVPQGPEIPRLPARLHNQDDFRLVLNAFDELIRQTDPIIESVVFNGVDANTVPLERLREATQWWKEYLSDLSIQAENPRLGAGDIDTFLSDLISKDRQLQEQLDRLNQVIELENRAAEDSE
ncbi:hypothetical protein [Salinispira pacifica]|uniref:Uncharacterized protein n=1 Tax=Salinispira pacifica TaxID=1307761 RepID=V5WGL0_9SPIO|nr:hypothetical protein [Salinispira pacifica]AHC14689.1 hypothetical protein L21SP2_1288 [Salinispira pacifica]